MLPGVRERGERQKSAAKFSPSPDEIGLLTAVEKSINNYLGVSILR